MKNLLMTALLTMHCITYTQSQTRLISKEQNKEDKEIENSAIRKINLPFVGQPMPDFTLKHIENYKTPKASLKDFSGKWLILDFFTVNCHACFKSFPKINALQKEFQDKIQFVLVGDNEHRWGGNVKDVYERISKKQKLDLSVAYDSTLFTNWGITSVPYVIVIDDKGIVRAINNSQDINSPNLKALLEGKDVSSNFRNIDYETWDYKKPFLIGGNGGPDTAYSFRSILSNWERPTPFMFPKSITSYNNLIDRLGGRKGYQASGIPVQFLYNLAYFDVCTVEIGDSLYGKTTWLPLFEGIDSSMFAIDSKTGKNIYNYSLTVPNIKATTPFIQEVMQRDLKNYFGFNAVIEQRRIPYWKLVVTKEAKEKLKAKGEDSFVKSYGGAGFEAINFSMKNFIRTLWFYHQTLPPIIDETGITTNIDIRFDALMSDFNDVKRELQRHGLGLVQGLKEMKVLVVSEDK